MTECITENQDPTKRLQIQLRLKANTMQTLIHNKAGGDFRAKKIARDKEEHYAKKETLYQKT